MFFKKRGGWLPPAKQAQQQQKRPASHRSQQPNDQLPFLSRSRFSALPHFQANEDEEQDSNLSLFIAILYVIDMFGVFPFVTLPALLVELGFFGIPLVISVVVLQIYTSFLLSECWTMAQILDSSITNKSRWADAQKTLPKRRHFSHSFINCLLLHHMHQLAFAGILIFLYLTIALCQISICCYCKPGLWTICELFSHDTFECQHIRQRNSQHCHGFAKFATGW